jgi:hypothetical protein
MLNLILALSSGVVGGLIVAVIPQTGRRLRNLVVLVFSVSGVVFSWRVAQMASEFQRISGAKVKRLMD